MQRGEMLHALLQMPVQSQKLLPGLPALRDVFDHGNPEERLSCAVLNK